MIDSKQSLHPQAVLQQCKHSSKMIEEALKPNGGNAQWGPEGYYFADGIDFVNLSIVEKEEIRG